MRVSRRFAQTLKLNQEKVAAAKNINVKVISKILDQ